MAALSDCSTDSTYTGVMPATSAPYTGYMNPIRGVAEMAPSPHEVCVCGRRFHPDGLYCLKCGARKPTAGLADMFAAFQDLQAGVARGVFEDMKKALEQAAEAAVEKLNGSMERMAGHQSSAGSVFASLKCASLDGHTFTGHSGYYTNEQTICHLLHLIVQLAIFPRQPMVAHHSGQAGASFSVHMSSPSQTEPPASATTQTQTDPPRTPDPPRRVGPICGVRIGGGYHMVQTPHDELGPRARELPGTVITSPRPPLENVACETLLRNSSQSPSPRRESNQQVDELVSQSPYAFGARSGGTPSERFRVTSYVPGAHEKERVLPDQAIRKHRTGDGVSLSRYLQSQTSKNEGAPGVARASQGKPKRPMSARGGGKDKARSQTWSSAFGSGEGPGGVPQSGQAFDAI